MFISLQALMGFIPEF